MCSSCKYHSKVFLEWSSCIKGLWATVYRAMRRIPSQYESAAAHLRTFPAAWHQRTEHCAISVELHVLSKFFSPYKHQLLQPKNLGKLFHWTGASFLSQHVNWTAFPEWPCHSGSSATLNFQRCQDSTKSDHLGGVVCRSRVFPDRLSLLSTWSNWIHPQDSHQ